MRVRRIEIESFRGIKSMDFRLPIDAKFVCLIGPGDSTKSTIIEAVHLALGERWSLSLNDTDFFGGDVEQPILIRVAVTGLSDEIRSHGVLGLHMAGIDADGEWHHDPTDDLEVCVIVQLRVDADMEPVWSIYRPGDPESASIGTGIRRKFSTFKIDDRVDNHLRWTRTSALTRLTDATHGVSATLANSVIAARAAVAGAVSAELTALTESVQGRLNHLGSGSFSDLKPGLDSSLSTAGGNLALFEGGIPLTSFGLGSRRISGIATQEMASADKAIILVDEIEYGLEPHRLVHLLNRFKGSETDAQVFVTTHSPVAVEQLASTDLVIVRNVGGATTATFVPADLEFAQATLRGGPSAFLARKVVVTEGKTEFGLLLGMAKVWDRRSSEAGTPTRAALGVAITNGNGANAPKRAKVLASLGYEVALFMDNDVRDIDGDVAEAEAAGVTVIRWETGKSTENALVDPMTVEQLTRLLPVAVETRVDLATVKSDLLNACPPGSIISDLDVQTWIDSHGFTLETARELISKAARKSSWFKSIPGGMALAQFILANAASLESADFGVTLMQAKDFIFKDSKSAEAT